ncbi:MAG TPA: DUF4158 domain-containing protein [Gemmatimonadaceae bacterium]|nr:DUF4158 domain-containing protein [Gemmatimonadaceae bacterium]
MSIGMVHTAAVVADLVRMFGGTPSPADVAGFARTDAADRPRLGVALVLCWLLADEWFLQAAVPAADVARLIDEAAGELAAGATAARFVQDADRREELARLALGRLGFRPAGETEAQAADRLTSLSTAERARVLRAAGAAEARARKVREALRRKAAEESADKWTRE